MLWHLVNALNASKRIVLASASPRRRQILQEQLKLRIEVVASQFDESSLDKQQFATVADFVQENSKQKALVVFDQLFQAAKESNLLVIASDSVVVVKAQGDKEIILEKPANLDHAREMMYMLSGSQHLVLSGVALVFVNQLTNQRLLTIVFIFGLILHVFRFEMSRTSGYFL